MASVADFVSRYLGLAQSTSASTGLPVDYILGQAGLETGWGTSNAAANNNFFGISPGGNLASYSDAASGFTAYSGLVTGSHYSNALAVASAGGSATDIGNAMNNAGYSTTPDYGTRVGNFTAQVDSVLGNGRASTTSDTATTATTAATATASSGGWLSGLTSWAAGYASRAALIVLAIVLIAGGIFLLGAKTIDVKEAVEAGVGA